MSTSITNQHLQDLILSGLDSPVGSDAHKASTFILDSITRNHSAFKSFSELTAAEDYRPTIRCYDKRTVRSARERMELEALAEAYDRRMILRGDDRRAYRGQKC